MATPAGFRPFTVHTGAMDIPGLVKGIEARIMEAAEEAVDETTTLGVKMAKRLAPVRKVSYIERRAKRRSLSRAEIAKLPGFASGGARNARGRFTGRDVQRATVVRRAQQILEAPEVEEFDGGFRLKDETQTSFLTGRGKRELRESGRHEPRLIEGKPPEIIAGIVVRPGTPDKLKAGTSAIYTQRFVVEDKSGRIRHGSRSTLGGRLRGEIHGERLGTIGGRIVYAIISPTPYAKFVELPTSRTAEQPYLRPTLKALRTSFKRRVFNNLKRAGLNPHPI